MAKRKDERVRIDVSGREAGARTPLAGLLRAAGLPVPEGAEAASAALPDASPASHASDDGPIDLASCGPLRLRKETKGRRGRTVTLIGGLGAGAATPLARVARIARDLGRALGCGASVEGEDVLLQGDLRDRAAAWLRERGAREVRATQ